MMKLPWRLRIHLPSRSQRQIRCFPEFDPHFISLSVSIACLVSLPEYLLMLPSIYIYCILYIYIKTDTPTLVAKMHFPVGICLLN